MAQSIKSLRGMYDHMPDDIVCWQWIEDTARQVFESYGYGEIRFPLVERTELFKRSIGEVTDIVEKEMYTFDDRKKRSITLRPEGTAGCVRAVLQSGLIHNQKQRLWYGGPMFRYEAPQEGRCRQFHQLGVETFGFSGPEIESELLKMSARLWQRLGLADRGHLELQINTLGQLAERNAYKAKLVDYFSRHKECLDEESLLRLARNPLRILDSKNAEMAEVISGAPTLLDALSIESREHFEALQQQLSDAGISFQCNPRLVRGLDYYSDTVFEWVTDQLGAQSAVCSGGRYDGLIPQLGGRATPAAGFALGMERLVALVAAANPIQPAVDVYLVKAGTEAAAAGAKFAELLRDASANLRVMEHIGDGSIKSQLKKADKSGARWALIIGDDEAAVEQVSIKHLREHAEQSTVPWTEAISMLTAAAHNDQNKRSM